MEYTLKLQKLCQVETRRWIFIVGLIAVTYLFCQSLLLPYGNALLSLVPDQDGSVYDNFGLPSRQYSVRSFMVKESLLSNASDLTDASLFVEVVKDVEKSNAELEFGDDNRTEGKDDDTEDDLALEREDLQNIVDFNEDDNGPDGKGKHLIVDFAEDKQISNDFPSKKVVDMDGITALNVQNQENSSDLKKDSETKHIGSAVHIVKPSNGEIAIDNISNSDASPMPSTPRSLGTTLKSHIFNTTFLEKMASNGSAFNHFATTDLSFVGKLEKEILPKAEHLLMPHSGLDNLNNNSAMTSNHGRKKMRSEMPPKSVTSIYEMNRRLVRHRASSRAMVQVFHLFY